MDSFYLLDFLKTFRNPKKIPIAIYLIMDMLFLFWGMWGISSGSRNKETVFVFSIAIYIFVLYLSLSSTGESIFRKINKCHPMEQPDLEERIRPLAEEVYQRAKAKEPSISDNVEFFIQYSNEKNAFAMGRSTICITSGLLALSDEQIKGILAHEFGHLANKDSDLALMVYITNLLLNAVLIFFWILFWILNAMVKFLKLFTRTNEQYVGMNLLDKFLALIQFLLIKVFRNLWNIIGSLLMLYADRDCEYRADRFSCDLGYGSYLLEYFSTCPDADPQYTTDLKSLLQALSTIGASHPATWKRIQAIIALQHNAVVEE